MNGGQANTARAVPPPLTAAGLERAALRYLERFACSAASLRRVLLRRVERSARDHGTDREAGRQTVEALVQRFCRSGLVDDAVYAEGRVASLRRGGASARAIRERLAEKGVAAALVEDALKRTDADHAGNGETANREEADFAAALTLARRRRLGPFRPAEARALHRQRDLAALGRAGFSYEIARRAIDGDGTLEE